MGLELLQLIQTPESLASGSGISVLGIPNCRGKLEREGRRLRG
jgi:hypothetical protein